MPLRPTVPCRAVLAFALMTALPGPARADDLDEAKAKAAQLVVLAKLAGTTCPGLGTDEGAVTAFLSHAQVSEADLGGRYKDATDAAALAFRTSSGQNRDFACAQLFKRLGEDGLGLVVERDEDPR